MRLAGERHGIAVEQHSLDELAVDGERQRVGPGDEEMEESGMERHRSPLRCPLLRQPRTPPPPVPEGTGGGKARLTSD